MEAKLAVSDLQMQANRPEQALRTLLQATHNGGEYEKLHRGVMRIFAHLGRRSEAAAHYQNLVATLRDRGLSPEPETEALYHTLMA
jgi:DNA-binding SARP family transcriptional activator